ncbi:hypothetical protein M422DRAFT_38210 [Sphaerobolus stellatus SS14]|uniref:Uncharacterized protein n=1 Tax=Sphaerobolus stellatus (strain SS14) TaxID=990650 RepID=A0A0C9TXE6_SPHS4|nr:hypothetical protein M422DRAFT_38210 [Sphaerobolus stellatus SS14]
MSEGTQLQEGIDRFRRQYPGTQSSIWTPNYQTRILGHHVRVRRTILGDSKKLF